MSDATKREFRSGRFDAIYSRETILHIKDKKALFQKIFVSNAEINLPSINVVCLVLTAQQFMWQFNFFPMFWDQKIKTMLKLNLHLQLLCSNKSPIA